MRRHRQEPVTAVQEELGAAGRRAAAAKMGRSGGQIRVIFRRIW